MSWISTLARSDIVALKAYEHAAWEPQLTRLHANELPWPIPGDTTLAGLNRYPQPQPRALRERLAALYGVLPESVLIGRGSDDAIDVLVRTFCRANRDAVLICPPTFGMYAVAAHIQGARVISVPLRASDGFALDEAQVLASCTSAVKLVFLCSPNNPTGNLLARGAVLAIARALAERALVVMDEAYVEFAGAATLVAELGRQPNLAILRTLSKAYGLAGARCGTLIAHPEVIALTAKVMPPYAIAQPTCETVLKLLEPTRLRAVRERIALIGIERERMARELARLSCVTRVHPSVANFILADFTDAADALARARHARLLVRSSGELPAALRITIGSSAQNDALLGAWS